MNYTVKKIEHDKSRPYTAEQPAASRRDKDIARVYALLQSKQPWGAVLDTAMDSVGKEREPTTLTGDSPSISALPVPPAAAAAQSHTGGFVAEETGNLSHQLMSRPDASSSLSPFMRDASGDINHHLSVAQKQADQPRANKPLRFSFTGPWKLMCIGSMVIAGIWGVALVEWGKFADHIRADSTAIAIRPLTPTTSEKSPVPAAAASLVATQSASSPAKTEDESQKDAVFAVQGNEIILVESHSSSSDQSELLKRGDSLLAGGDLTSARLFYERAADSGDAQGALKLGETYDPQFLTRINSIGTRADATIAARWYRRAKELGANEAELLLQSTEKP